MKLKHYQLWTPTYFNASCYYMYGLELWPDANHVLVKTGMRYGRLMPVVHCHRYEFYGLNN